MFCSHFQKEKRGTDDSCFDCNTVIPMPAFLNITCGGHVKQYANFLQINGSIVNSFIAGKTSINELKTATLINNQPEMISLFESYKKDALNSIKYNFEEARKYLSNILKYGYTDWYPWCNANWGTKWGAYDGQTQMLNGAIHADFQSAWSAPDPVLLELAKLYPEVEIQHSYLDEGYGFGGTVTYMAGEEYDNYNADDVSQFAQEEFGYEPYDEEDEDE
jgi:hypothetical protein